MSDGTWSSIIAAIKTPLGFFSLVVLVLNSILGALALKSGPNQESLVVVFAAVLVLVILIVAATTHRQASEEEQKNLKQNESFAVGLGEEIYTALDGSLRNLSEEEWKLAYDLLEDCMTDSPYARSRVEKRFFLVVLNTIQCKAGLAGKHRNLPD